MLKQTGRTSAGRADARRPRRNSSVLIDLNRGDDKVGVNGRDISSSSGGLVLRKTAQDSVLMQDTLLAYQVVDNRSFKDMQSWRRQIQPVSRLPKVNSSTMNADSGAEATRDER